MAKNFTCPHCGATNEFPDASGTVRCAYCGRDVQPPSGTAGRAAVLRLGPKAKMWIILFVVVVFVLPACLGLGGTIIGIAASILGALAAFFAPFIGG